MNLTFFFLNESLTVVLLNNRFSIALWKSGRLFTKVKQSTNQSVKQVLSESQTTIICSK